MQVQKAQFVDRNFNGFMNSKALLKTAEFAADNGALFAAGTSLFLSTFVRPMAILATPKATQENKEYAIAKSISSSLVGFGIMALISNPIIKAVKNIEQNPSVYLSEKTIKNFVGNEQSLSNSTKFKFSAQMFKLGSGFVSVFPKALVTCALIPPVMSLFFNKNPKNKNNSLEICKDNPKTNHDTLSFGANSGNFTQNLSKIFGKIMNTNRVQKLADKYHDANFPQHIFNANDVLATVLFAKFTQSSKKIKEERKKTLILNASFMTAFTVVGGYAVNALLKKPTEIFIEKFKRANAASPKLDKYVEGIKIAKPAIILGVLYYILAPVLSTMLAEVFTKNSTRGEKC